MTGQIACGFKPSLTGGWHELPKSIEQLIAKGVGSEDPNFAVYERRIAGGERLLVFVERHAMDAEARRYWHLSISHQIVAEDGHSGKPGRYPTWDEIKDARYRFTPSDIEMCMILPRPSDFVNVHETCFHLHQHFEPGEA